MSDPFFICRSESTDGFEAIGHPLDLLSNGRRSFSGDARRQNPAQAFTNAILPPVIELLDLPARHRGL